MFKVLFMAPYLSDGFAGQGLEVTIEEDVAH
jgi:hypothetical protein